MSPSDTSVGAVTGPSIWTCGEAMVALRTDGPLHLGTPWTTHIGGAELNASIGLARLGHRVTWCSAVGDDPYGRFILREARAEAVDADVRIDPERPTGLMRVIRQAQTAQVGYNRAGSAASALDDAVLLDSLNRADPALVLLTGITPALSTTALAGWSAVLRRALEQGRTVVLDVNHRATLWTSEQAAAALHPLVDGVHTVVGDLEELAIIADPEHRGLSEAELVAALFARGVQQVALKRGAEGATLHLPGRRIDRAADPATEVDPIGAGDAFTAGLIAALAEGLDAEQQLARAVAMGAWAVSTAGDWEGLPTRAQLLAGRGGVHR